MWKTNCGRVLSIAAAAIFFALAAPTAGAEEPPAVTIIFDGSGSMWGNIEGSKANKFVLAREAVRRGLAKVPAQTRVGLASFGHRRGDCLDVELMRAPGPLDAQQILDQLEKLNPRGRGPLAHALREAAKPLAVVPGKRSLLLIHDDADNCQQNVCTAAEELARAGITTHVVGLGLRPDDAARMACLPQTTGGRMFNAVTVEQINAAVEEALRLASGDAGNRPSTSQSPAAGLPAAPPPNAAVPMPPADAKPGLYLRALLAPKTEPVGLPLDWTVYPEGQPAAALFARRAPSPHFPVEPGRYVVEAREGPVSASEVVVVGANGPTVFNLVLNAGTLRVRAQAQKSNIPLGDAIVTISEAAQVSDGRKDAPAGPPLAVFKGSEGLALLQPGRYVVRVEQGAVRTERSVVVPVGSQGRTDIVVNAARLQLSVVGRDLGGSSDVLTFSVVEDDPDAPRGRREVARAAGRQVEFALQPGTYYVIARLGLIEARDSVALGPGDVVKRTLSVAAGRLALATKPIGGPQALSEPVSYRIERIDAVSPEAISTSRASPVLLLPGGRYRVEGRYGAMNVRTTRDVEVKAGQTQQLTLEHQAASLKVRLVSNSGASSSDVAWEIVDDGGNTIWATAQAEPVATLQAGRYSVRAETRDKRYNRTIELRAGESRLLEINAD